MRHTGNLRALAVALAALALTRQAGAQTATQTVTYQVDAINQISVSGAAIGLHITTATAGSAPTSVTDGSTTWAVTTNQSGAKITAAINSDMPSGVTLTLTLGAPTGATSAGAVALSHTAADVVTGITKLNESGLSVSYDLAATSAAGVVNSATKTVTLTITGGT